MKTFTETERLEIQQRIERATGLPFVNPHPEFFLSGPTPFHQLPAGPKIAYMDNTAAKYPHVTMLWVHPSGDAICLGEIGVN